jgi:hypothetical protein
MRTWSPSGVAIRIKRNGNTCVNEHLSPKEAKIQTKAHNMDILGVLDNEPLKSHANVRGKRQRQTTRLLFVQKVQEWI